ncbi:MAG: SH3 domain-containing protein [Coriobacteriales bacterium]
MATEAKETQAKKPAKKAAEKKPAPAKEQAAEKKAAASEKAPAAARYVVTVPLLNIREKASLNSHIIGTLERGAEVEVATRTPQGFGKLADRDGYIALEFAKALEGERP